MGVTGWHCHHSLSLPSQPVTAITACHCHHSLSLPSQPVTAITACHCHHSLSLPSQPSQPVTAITACHCHHSLSAIKQTYIYILYSFFGLQDFTLSILQHTTITNCEPSHDPVWHASTYICQSNSPYSLLLWPDDGCLYVETVVVTINTQYQLAVPDDTLTNLI
jgi:hypothetical protein